MKLIEKIKRRGKREKINKCGRGVWTQERGRRGESFRRKLDRAELGNKGLEEEWIAFKGKVKKVMKDMEKESEEKERKM